jgi:hypothetical protein
VRGFSETQILDLYPAMVEAAVADALQLEDQLCRNLSVAA